MSQIVQIKSPVLAVVTDTMAYINARNQAEVLSNKHRLRVADMPIVIQAMTTHPEVREVIRSSFIDTITGEYHGLRDKDRYYEVWHSVGSLATAEGLKEPFLNARDYAFMPISDDEWASVGKGSYNCQTVTRVNIEDARKGDNIPVPGTPYTIFVRLDKDNSNINGIGYLNYDTFMKDDRVLMITGSPERRKALAKMLFGKKEEGGEGWYHIFNRGINYVSFDAQAEGHLTYLGYCNSGLNNYHCIRDDGRFVVVGAEDEVCANSQKSEIFGAKKTKGF